MRVFIAVALAASIALSTVSAEDKKKPQQQTQTKEDENKPVVDLVCGMTVTPKDAAGKSVYKGKNYYFCSKDDKETFDKTPDQFVKPEKK
jgi:Cu+-exporting ATPase